MLELTALALVVMVGADAGAAVCLADSAVPPERLACLARRYNLVGSRSSPEDEMSLGRSLLSPVPVLVDWVCVPSAASVAPRPGISSDRPAMEVT